MPAQGCATPGATRTVAPHTFERGPRPPSVDDVATFVIETYLSRLRAGELDAIAAGIRAAIDSAPDAPERIRHVRSFFVPDDESCFHVIEAPSLEMAVDAARRAGLSADRVVKAETTAG